jgi:hypothetical protein
LRHIRHVAQAAIDSGGRCAAGRRL